MKKNGGWVFISHSHLDINLVRKIRNEFENRGFEPLLFYLKCLNDEDEIVDLIKREIDAREWFIYVESANSKTSKWVRSEREYIAGLNGKKIFTINLDQDIYSQIERIARQLQIFVSYSNCDKDIAYNICRRLIEEEFLVLQADDIQIDGTPWENQITSMINSACYNGFVAVILTPKSVKSEYVYQELEHAVKMNGKIVPIYVDDVVLDERMNNLIGDLQGVHINQHPTNEELEQLVKSILHRIKFYKSDFTNLVGFQSATSIMYPYIGRIEDYTFWDCYNLRSVTIPECVTYISDKAFKSGQDVLVKCNKDSYAEQYCKKHGIRYEIID